jgi:hypothetical protein
MFGKVLQQIYHLENVFHFVFGFDIKPRATKSFSAIVTQLNSPKALDFQFLFLSVVAFSSRP